MKQKSKMHPLLVLFIAFTLGLLVFNGDTLLQLMSSIPLPAASSFVPEEAQGKLQVFFFDVGQGDSQLLRIPRGDGYLDILVDTGENAYVPGLISRLEDLGVERLEALVVTHPHTDHMGGAASVLSRLPVSVLYLPEIPESQTPTTVSYERMLEAAAERGVPLEYPVAGEELPVGEKASLAVLAPERGAAFEEMNNYSLVLRLDYGESSFLFTGDGEKESEKIMVEAGYPLGVDVLACGHHGSKTSSSADFLRACLPRFAVISCGRDNSYGHPHEGTLKKLKLLETQVFRTDEQSTILAASDGSTLQFFPGLKTIERKD